MAELSKQALKVENNTEFPNNNAGLITPEKLRGFNVDMIDSLVDEISYNIDSASWNSSIDNINAFTASASGLTTGSLLITASATQNVITFTKGDGSQFNVTVADTTDLSPLNQATQSLQAFTQSANIRLSNLEGTTASLNTSITNINAFTQSAGISINLLNQSSASQQAQINSLIAGTGSYATTGSNIFTGGNTFTSISASSFVSASAFVGDGSKITNITASISMPIFNDGIPQGNANSLNFSGSSIDATVIANIGIITVNAVDSASFSAYTSSTDARLTNIENTTASLNTAVTNINNFTSSANQRLTAIESVSGSWITESETGSFARVDAQNTFTQNNSFLQNVSIAGNLYVSGSEVIVSSSTLIVGDRIIEINANRVIGDAGIYVFDAIGDQTGSLIWNPNLDYWLAGLSGSETRVITAADTASMLSPYITSASVATSQQAQDIRIDGLSNQTGSYITSAETSSMTVLSSSFALTASFALNANFDTGAFTTTSSFNAYTQSNDAVVNALVSATSSYVTEGESGSFLITASFDNNTRDLTFTKGDASTFSLNIPDTSGSAGNFVTTASFNTYTQSNDDRVTSLENATASLFTSASLTLVTASVNNDDITFTKGDGTQFTIQVATGSFALSASYAETASIAQFAQDIVVTVKNTTGAQLNKGTIVRIIGATGDNALIQTASWEDDNNSANTLGWLYENIPNDGFGRVITQGTLLGVNTDPTLGFTAGQILYLSSSGQYTNVIPPAPYHEVRVGQVLRAQQNNGSVYVLIQNGYELNELHDVNINTGSLVNNDILAYDSASAQWENKTLTEVGGVLSSSFNQYTQSTDSRLTNIENTTQSLDNSVSLINTATASLFTSASLAVVTASVNLNTITFTKGDASTFALTVDTGSGGGGGGGFPFVGDAVITGSLLVSGSTIPDVRVIGNIDLTGSFRAQPVTLTVTSNTASIDMNLSNYFILNLPTSSTTHINFTNITPGENINLLVSQSATAATGSVSFPGSVLFPGGLDYQATATGSARDIVSFIAFTTSQVFATQIKNLS